MPRIIIYVLIFLAVSTNLMLVTIRAILTARGEKLLNTICGFIQVTVYIFSTAYVVIGITEDFYKVIAYTFGCAFGCYMGMVVDEWFAIGKNMVTIIVSREDSNRLVTMIREKGFAVTTIDANSPDGEKEIFVIGLKRKKEKKLINSILKNEKNAVIIDESINSVGGYY